MSPRLSVIIPTRNALNTLPRAVASAVAVPISGLEVVVVDDGSSDGTGAWLAALSAQEPRLVVLTRQAGPGVAAARNAGIAAARGAVLGFLDADDVWDPPGIARRLAWHEALPETAFSFSNYRTLLPDGTLQDRYMGYTPRFQRFVAGRSGMLLLGRAAFGLLAGENPVCTSSVLASRQAVAAVGGFDNALRQAEDWDLWLRLSLHGAVVASTGIEALHASHPGSLSARATERLHAVQTVLQRYRAEAWQHGIATGLAVHGALALARAEQALHQGRAWGVLYHSAAAAGWQPSAHHAKDAARAALVVAGIRPPLLASHACGLPAGQEG